MMLPHLYMGSIARAVHPLSHDYVSHVPRLLPRPEKAPAALLLQVVSLAISMGLSLWAMNYILVKMDPSASAKAAASTERARLERRLGRRFTPLTIFPHASALSEMALSDCVASTGSAVLLQTSSKEILGTAASHARGSASA